MSTISDILPGLKTTFELNSTVVSVAGAVDRLAADMPHIDRRLVRVETIIENVRPAAPFSVLQTSPTNVPVWRPVA